MKRLSLGNIVCTPTILKNMSIAEINNMLRRHQSGDWGDLCEEDKKLNEEALIHGDRIMSAYINTRGEKVWIITEWDRSYTTILYPDEY